ncbi:M14-type cytosolic carboxypeptidase [Thiotrichales bacterium 19S3-7]|nr:M14-type cytosolic carboxypeptidase [Thiotrichales bacterium 19S3-7]MCF6802914.1 M14-type cytosolic carboxypeptidase [Thiotrichales bacterium 19S3-11]
MQIYSNFDGGSIEIHSIDGHHAMLTIPKDTHSEFLQWFYFQVNIKTLTSCSFSILNAGETSYPEGWVDYYPCISYDRKNWQRIGDADFDGKQLDFSFMPLHKQFYLAYFAPFSYEQHLNLIAKAQCQAHITHHILGQTVQKRNIDLLYLSKTDKPLKKIWVIARQHPGETMAEWFIDGLITKLAYQATDEVDALLKNFAFYIVPNMNVDGAFLGNLRVNAKGVNLNREWLNPTIEHSPEVYYVLEKIKQTGVDLFLDIHGDEALPYNFISASEGVPNLTDKLYELEQQFIQVLLNTSNDFQREYGYAIDEKGQANLSLASNYIANTFLCPSLTIEMPFKDNANAPNLVTGWSPERSQKFAEDTLTAIAKFYQVKT